MDWFLHPGYLWFAAAGSIPVIIHLINRQKYRRVRWAAMPFLLAAIRKMRRRLQVENLLLLLVRIAVLLLLALVVARPLLSSGLASAADASDTHLVLVLDASFSMGYRSGQKTPLDRAKAGAAALLDGLKPGERDRASLIVWTDAPHAVIGPPTNDLGRAKSAVADVALSDRGNRLGALLPVLLDVLEKSDNRRKRIVLFTDLQRTAWDVPDAEAARANDALKALTAKPGVSVTVMDVGENDPRNRAAVRFAAEDDVVVARRPVRLTAEVQNFSPENIPALAVSLVVDDDRKQTLSLPLDAGASGQVTFRYEFPAPGPHALRVELDPDFLAADDRRHLSVDVREQIRVLAVDGEEGGGPASEDETFFFTRALSPSREAIDRASLFQVERVGPLAFAGHRLDRTDVVVLANVGDLSEERAEALEAFVRDGGGLLVALGDQVDAALYNRLLWRDGRGLLPLSLGERCVDYAWDRPVALAKIDFTHAGLRFFRPFEAVFGSLLSFEFFRTGPAADPAPVPAVPPGAPGVPSASAGPPIRVLGRYEDPDESPWLAEREFGRGRVLLLTTSLDAEWNYMPKAPPYAVLWNELGKALAARTNDGRNLAVGEWIRMTIREREFARSFRLETPGEGYVSLIPAKISDERYVLQFPGGESAEIADAHEASEKPSETPADSGTPRPAGRDDASRAGVGTAGIYRLLRPEEGGAGAGAEEGDTLACFAVNVRPEESDLERTSDEEIRRRFPGFKFESPTLDRDDPSKVSVRNDTSTLWRWFLFGVLALLATESLLAWRFNRS